MAESGLNKGGPMEMPNEAQQNLLTSITRDCGHILEAIRRLREGTWHLSDEDADWAGFLLPQIRKALQDHIEYESLCVFPDLSEEAIKEHSAEHERIVAVLWALEQSMQAKDSERFHSLLDVLVHELDKHHQEFGCHHAVVDHCDGECATARIIRRAQGSVLEKI